MRISLHIMPLKLKHRLKYSKKAALFSFPTQQVNCPRRTDYCRMSTHTEGFYTTTERNLTNTSDMDTVCPCSPLTQNSTHRTCFCTFTVQKVNCAS